MSNNHESKFPSIPSFFCGKSIAITGATGFIGQLLIEKLLRSCPDIKKVYLLIRSNKATLQERLDLITSLPIFDKLKASQPEFSTKLAAISCELEDENFGLNDESLSIIKTNVNIFFHCAAILKFDEHLKRSFEINTLGVRWLLKLCKQIDGLEAFVHVSTAYTYCDRETIAEEVYPTGWNYDRLCETMKIMSDAEITKRTPAIVGNRPNTYTLTKAFGEEVIVKEGIGLPLCIVRPSIIGASYKEPLPGWCANINGPTGLFIAYAKGCLRVLRNNNENCMDVIPSDFVVNGIIAAAWKTALDEAMKKLPKSSFTLLPNEVSSYFSTSPPGDDLQSLRYSTLDENEIISHRRKSVPVYHFVANTGRSLTLSSVCDIAVSTCDEYPVANVFRAPHMIKNISNKYLYLIFSFVLEYLPAAALDVFRISFGQKPKLLRHTRRMIKMQGVLYYFYSHVWTWKTDNALQLERELSEEDQKKFCFIPKSIDWQQYFKQCCIGTSKYILKEDPRTYPLSRRRVWRLRLLDRCFQFCLVMISSWLLYRSVCNPKSLRFLLFLRLRLFSYFQRLKALR